MLEVNNLRIFFSSNTQEIEVVKNISFKLNKNKILGIVGESGSGKSVTSMALLGLLPKNTIVKGQIFYQGTDLVGFSNKDFQKIRGKKIGI